MTEIQFKKYKELTEEIEPLKNFLFWCGKKYRCSSVGSYQTRILKKKFCVGRVGCGAIESTEVKLPLELQSRIVDVIEQYVDEKQKEIDEI